MQWRTQPDEMGEKMKTCRMTMALMAALATVGCPAKPPPAGPQDASPTAPTGPTAPSCAPVAEWTTDAVCSISSPTERLGTVTVTPDGAETFDLTVDDATVTVSPGADPGAVPVHVQAVLEFDAVSAEVVLRPAGPLDAAVPMVRLGTDASIEHLHASDDGFAGDVTIATGVTIDDVPFGCDGMTVDHVDRRIYVHPRAPDGDTIWVPVQESITFAETPEGGRCIEVTADSETLVPMTRLEERDGMVRVRVEYLDGGSIEGWVLPEAIHGIGPVGYGGWGDMERDPRRARGRLVERASTTVRPRWPAGRPSLHCRVWVPGRRWWRMWS